MLLSVLSRKGGTGCTTLVLTLGSGLNRDYNKKVCVLDLKENNDTRKLLNLNTDASVGNLITAYGISSKFSTIEENIVSVNGIDVIPSTTVPFKGYLTGKISKIKDLIVELNKRYDYVILDMEDGEVFKLLMKNGVESVRINVLTQNILVATEYNKEITQRSLEGLIVVNMIDPKVFPKSDYFKSTFNQNKVFFTGYSSQLKTIINSHGISFKEISKTQYYKDLQNLLEEIVNSNCDSFIDEEKTYTEDDVDSVFLEVNDRNRDRNKNLEQNKSVEVRKNKSFFSKLFGKGGVKYGRQ